ncbi:MAG: DUF1553 domain-containing protein [Verrucomicrobiales bacterium]|nr:DUF1553 domain-containing protein [Verrucomicrobiales bacterium]
MKFACPHCSQHLDADEAWIGRSIACPACAHNLVVPPAPPQSSSELPPAQGASQRRGKRGWGIACAVAFLALVWGLSGRMPISGWLSSWTAPPVESLEVFPPSIHISSREDRQSLVVQAVLKSGATRDVTAQASIRLADASVARVEAGIIQAKSDGQTQLRVRYGGKEKTIPLSVSHAQEDRSVSFRLDVMPVLMKAGCNSGGCHGASRGKDGFHLSLFGYDPDGDYDRLTREWVGRRINLALPEESLVLEKAIARVPHGGGERFKVDSDSYRVLLRWLQAGAPPDLTNVPSVLRLEVMPSHAVLEGKDSTQKLSIRAHYTDGSDRDVTSLAVFFTSNEVAAKVSEAGLVTAGQRGEAFVMARFETHTVGAQIIVVPPGSSTPFPEVPANNYIDELVQAKLRKLRMQPSPLCDDATFIRRAYLDVTGTLPTARQVEEFVEDMGSGKREQLIDELLKRKEFADLWVMKFAELLQIRSAQDQFSYKSALQYYDWLRDQLLANVPINKIVQSLMTGTGSTFRQPQANYYQVQTDTLKLAENTAQVFMGMRIQCAQCHNHPFDRWTMDDYYGFASFFARVGRKPGEDPREFIVYDRPEGEIKHPVGGRPMPPKFLGGETPNIEDPEGRREALATWLASPNNPYFAKNLANVVWAHFMGRGIIDPVDDVRVSNPASNPELLESLGKRFTEYQYDFRRLVRDICNSRTYQLSTRTNDSNALDDRNFARGNIRRLRAEVLLDVLTQVTETKNKFQGLPRGSKAVEIPDGNVNNYFLRTFGRATRTTVCSCEVRTEPNLSQALHLLNGATTHEKIEQGGVVKKLIKEGKRRQEVVDELYLRCLARKPTPEEVQNLEGFFKEAADPVPVLNDLFWALLNSKEFVFNH